MEPLPFPSHADGGEGARRVFQVRFASCAVASCGARAWPFMMCCTHILRSCCVCQRSPSDICRLRPALPCWPVLPREARSLTHRRLLGNPASLHFAGCGVRCHWRPAVAPRIQASDAPSQGAPAPSRDINARALGELHHASPNHAHASSQSFIFSTIRLVPCLELILNLSFARVVADMAAAVAWCVHGQGFIRAGQGMVFTHIRRCAELWSASTRAAHHIRRYRAPPIRRE